MAEKLILVTGATGKQGGSLIATLRPGATEQTIPFRVLALTRNAGSHAAKQLAQEKHVDVVEGNLDDEKSLRKVFDDAKARGGIWGVFCVLAFPGLGANADGEEKQGKTLADLALEFGVSSFVFSSVERGGESYDDKLDPDRRAKVQVERHIKDLGAKGLQWTILRPGFFMENFDGTIGAITVGVLKAGLQPTTTVPFIAADDIGRVAGAVFKSPEPYRSQILVVVGDILTMQQMDEAYKAATGQAIPSTPRLVALSLIKLNHHTQGVISDLERVHSTQSDPSHEKTVAQMNLARQAYPDMTSFQKWAERRKGKELKREKNWNQVSIGKLFMGKQ
ncbi:NmrA-like family domain-containing protein 1 [Hypsizygus marmoreus]|uniref:NmrA-like family domain-containing protein 1 n=1 Tax=Hypsizygus marmoreus TaxID=39966 RepID=A0A369J760_HYPMA|nr:NmrA-like family domain-containing protein 1 [Hypsizygus marmoreus]